MKAELTIDFVPLRLGQTGSEQGEPSFGWVGLSLKLERLVRHRDTTKSKNEISLETKPSEKAGTLHGNLSSLLAFFVEARLHFSKGQPGPFSTSDDFYIKGFQKLIKRPGLKTPVADEEIRREVSLLGYQLSARKKRIHESVTFLLTQWNKRSRVAVFNEQLLEPINICVRLRVGNGKIEDISSDVTRLESLVSFLKTQRRDTVTQGIEKTERKRVKAPLKNRDDFSCLLSIGSVLAVGFTAAGCPVALVGHGTEASLWEIEDRISSHLPMFCRHSRDIEVGAISSGGLLVTGGQDTRVQVWNPASDSPIWCWKSRDWVKSVAFSADGDYVAACGGGYIQVWNVTDGSEVRLIRCPEVRCVAISSKASNLFAVAGKELLYWDLAHSKPYDRLTDQVGSVAAIDCSGAGGRVVYGSENGAGLCCDQNGSFTLHPNVTRVSCVRLDVGGNHAFTAARCEDATECTIWNLDARASISNWRQEAPVCQASFSPTGDRIIAADSRRTVRVRSYPRQ